MMNGIPKIDTMTVLGTVIDRKDEPAIENGYAEYEVCNEYVVNYLADTFGVQAERASILISIDTPEPMLLSIRLYDWDFDMIAEFTNEEDFETKAEDGTNYLSQVLIKELVCNAVKFVKCHY